MSFVEKRPRKWGDRRDGHWVKDAPGLNVVLCSLLPKRTESEVYLHQEIDVTALLKYLEGKNTPDAPYKTTLFHCIVTMVARVINERPKQFKSVKAIRAATAEQLGEVIGPAAGRSVYDYFHREEEG